MDKTRLSYSQLQKYQMCPKSYQFYYIDKIRVDKTTGALVFGKALDAALNNLLISRDLKKAEEIFETEFSTFQINFKTYSTKSATNIVYSVHDFDKDLLPEDLKLNIPYEDLVNKRKQVGFDSMSVEEKSVYNTYNFYSMLIKGKIMIRDYYNTILPKITKVHAVQEKIEFANTSGDIIVGFVDAIVDIDGFKNVLIDHKTSSVKYEADSVKFSQQLALYKYFRENVEWLAYIVFNKRLLKNKTKKCKICSFDGSNTRHKTCNNIINNQRCGGEWNEIINPTADIEIIVDKIDEVVQELVIQNLDDINQGIKNKYFPRNLQACRNYWGGECDYFKVCYSKENTKKEDL